METSNADRRGSPRYVVAVVAGFCLVLVGIQLPYWNECPGIGPCVAHRLIDLTPDGGTESWSTWHVAVWYARLAGLVSVLMLIVLHHGLRRRASGFIAFTGLVLLVMYLGKVTPLWLAGAGFEPPVLLWPTGALVMLLGAIRVRDGSARHAQRLRPTGWLVLLLGTALTGVALRSVSEPAAYVFAAGMAAAATGTLILPDSGQPPNRIYRMAAVLSLLLGTVAIGVAVFIPWGGGRYPYTPIQTRFLFSPTREDLWTAVFALAVIAGAVVACVQLMRTGAASPFVTGGALAGAYWITAPVVMVVRPEAGGGPSAGPGVYFTLVGALLIWAATLPILRHAGSSESLRAV